MKKGIGIALIVLGLLFAAFACVNAKRAPNLGYLMGTYLPGILLLAVGAKLQQKKILPGSVGTENPLLALQVRRRTNAETGVLGGIVLMFVGSGLSQQGPELFLFGTAVSLGGWGLMIAGAVNYMKWKGYSGWFGLLGLMLLPGLIILACFPNRMKDLGSPFRQETKATLWPVVIAVVAVVLLIVLPMAAFVMLPFFLSQLPRAQTAYVWATVASDPPKFTVEMPANPKRQVVTQEGAQGGVTVTTYESRDDIATYTAGFMPLTPDPKPGMPQKMVEEVLDTMLNGTASQMRGRVLYRKSISLGNYFGREQAFEFNPGIKNRAGEPIVGLMVWKLYLVRDSILMMTVSLPKSDSERQEMDRRIARFFDSLKVE
jgi:hypothetical protein